MLRKLSAIILALLVMTLLFAGCSSENPPANPSVNPAVNTPSSEPSSEPSEPTEATPEPVDPSSASTDPADYWVSDTEFDMIGFCEAFGYENPQIIDEGSNDILYIRLIKEVNGKRQMVKNIQLGQAGHWIEVWYYDWDNMTATLFNGNDTRIDPDKVTYTGTSVTQYKSMMDFILYVIPRTVDETIDDPMYGVGHAHAIGTCEIKTTDTGWTVDYAYDVEHVNE